ncbi:HD domain-containing protein [Halomonas icarae]|uniref:HD domain-containing protein n=1 Tax=Halomonas icarae TaxID=2691040 RepID=A0A7X5AKK9_9GAMM|nr:HD domain-containing protein [Halomonas icarae]MDR5901123.1 HD domain-containing protein [Halomonas icarae]NAW11400.1 HD domain-containing protein [Halomonas icarae]
MSHTPDTVVETLAALFAEQGAKSYLGESVTMAEHMLQGAWLAEQQGESDEIIVAALLHDIGHFAGDRGTFALTDTEDRCHESTGAALVEAHLPPAVVACIREHVAAKRYLCAVDPTYADTLSKASQHSLRLQGGPMSTEEAADFARHPHLEAILKVRLLDDAGKEAGRRTPDFAHFAHRVRRLIEAHARRAS